MVSLLLAAEAGPCDHHSTNQMLPQPFTQISDAEKWVEGFSSVLATAGRVQMRKLRLWQVKSPATQSQDSDLAASKV